MHQYYSRERRGVDLITEKAKGSSWVNLRDI